MSTRCHRSYYYVGELLGQIDLSLMVKSGVQYSLWGGSVLNLGTEVHRCVEILVPTICCTVSWYG